MTGFTNDKELSVLWDKTFYGLKFNTRDITVILYLISEEQRRRDKEKLNESTTPT